VNVPDTPTDPFGFTPEEQADHDLAKLLKEGVKADTIPVGIVSLVRKPEAPASADADVWLGYAAEGPDTLEARATIHRVERGGHVAIDISRTRAELAASIQAARLQLVGMPAEAVAA
jgi:hypothetical protein